MPAAFIASISWTAVSSRVFIFQLPATSGRRGLATLSAELHQSAGVRHGQREHLFGGEDAERAVLTGSLVELVHRILLTQPRPEHEGNRVPAVGCHLRRRRVVT